MPLPSDPIKDLSNAANTIIANSGLVPDTVVMGGTRSGVPEQCGRAGATEPVAPGRGRDLADCPDRSRHGAIRRTALSALLSDLRIQRDLRRRSDQRAQADDRCEVCPARLLEVLGAHQLRQRSTQIEQDGEARATRTSSSFRDGSRSRRRTASSLGSLRAVLDPLRPSELGGDQAAPRSLVRGGESEREDRESRKEGEIIMNALTIIHSGRNVLDSRGRAISNYDLLAGYPSRAGVLKPGTLLTRPEPWP